jgi:hypothetical protein
VLKSSFSSLDIDDLVGAAAFGKFSFRFGLSLIFTFVDLLRCREIYDESPFVIQNTATVLVSVAPNFSRVMRLEFIEIISDSFLFLLSVKYLHFSLSGMLRYSFPTTFRGKLVIHTYFCSMRTTCLRRWTP